MNPLESHVCKALRPYGTTIFTEMTALSNKVGAISLSQGFPDFDGPEVVRRAAAEAIIRGPNQYCPSIGIPELRKAIAQKTKRFYGVDMDLDREITVTAGATEAIASALLGLLDEGTYYVSIEIGNTDFEDDLAFCRYLAEEVGVAAIPCSFFWKERRDGKDLVRFCFCKKDETLQEAIKKLKRWRS